MYYTKLLNGAGISPEDVSPFVFKHKPFEVSAQISKTIKTSSDTDDIVGLLEVAKSLKSFNETGGILLSEKMPDDIVAAPFKKFTIEVEDGVLTIPSQNDEYPISTVAMYCEEVGPNQYNFAVLCLCDKNPKIPFYSINEISYQGDMKMYPIEPRINIKPQMVSDGTIMYASYLNLVHKFLDRLYNEERGYINGGDRIKYKDSTGKKRVYKEKNIIYVYPKKSSGTEPRTKSNQRVRPIAGHWVRAFWRRLPNPEWIGHDRYGNEIKGVTFVDSFKKGDIREDTPKIRKVLR